MRTTWTAVLATAIALVAAIGVVPRASAAPEPTRLAEMQRLLEVLRSDATAPGAGITFGDGEGDDVTLGAGTRNLLNYKPIKATDQVRVGSNTKTFTSVVALQLVDDGVLQLDVPIDHYLPGVLRYPDAAVPGDPARYDGRTVTLRQLLQHTAGVPDYASDLTYVLNPVHQVVPPRAEDHLATVLPKGPTSVPGTTFGYSNTHYALVGMIIERTTGHPLQQEIASRIAGPLHLGDTFSAGPGEKAIPGPHVRGYVSSNVPLDMTNFEPAVWGAAGAVVSSPDDMNTFISALLAGRLLSPAMLREMQTTVPYLGEGFGYGLGLVRIPLSCGEAWGHAGFLAGYQTFSIARTDGRHAFFTLNGTFAIHLAPPPPPTSAYELIELAIC